MIEALHIHCPKTGGTALRNAMMQDENSDRYGQRNPKLLDAAADNLPRIISFSHWRPAGLIENGYVTRNQLDQWLVFSVLRNPWARLVSGYFAGVQHPRPANRKFFEDMSFTTFDVFAEWAVTSREVPFPRKSGMKEAEWTHPQCLWFVVDGECVIDELMRTETLTQEWEKFRIKLGIESQLHPASNASRHEHYRTYYTKRLRNLVGDYYADDIAMGNYSF